LVVAGTREAADDATQEAFAAAFRALDRFDTSRPFGPWIARIAVNRALDGFRRRRPEVDVDDVEVTDERALDAFAAVLGDDRLADRVARLPAGQRAVLVLRYWHDLRPVEVAEVLGVAEGTVHSREKRALDVLRGELEVAL
jgi:RNA polymerase sigma-70 factor (ECF subfamily)